MDLGHLSSAITGVLTLTTLLTGALFSWQRGTMSNIQTRADELGKTATALRDRIGDLEKEIVGLKAKAVETGADLASIHAENDLLKRLNAQSVDWTAVIDLLEHHHSSAEGHWDNLDGALEKVHDSLTLVADRLEQQKRRDA